ncbi:uncharacterized protein EV422DRAFT_510321 [Fimicolochytrium jonesii]|uniref:uncharacterized protein n=1 Tax=Fimicolochytrium jonesii TaxID=1396493 RepID=UPI0022FF3C12|nr:uncharacterized protein EV422DRAFT_510321 [Fimicolochytrium jonesii]KAI8815764.1 hypothetical protein EV422DRAFT_510321 [Fimicolochytrium jonesii]
MQQQQPLRSASRLRTPFAILTLTTASVGLITAYHYRRLETLPAAAQLPATFRSLITPTASWGLYKRRLNRPVVLTSTTGGDESTTTLGKPANGDNQHRKNTSAIQKLTTGVLTSRPYDLEVSLSRPEENAKDVNVDDIGVKFGNLVLEQRPDSASVVFRYQHPGIDYRLYLSVVEGPGNATNTIVGNVTERYMTPDTIMLGFVDYSNSKTHELGSRVFVPILCEAAARMIERGEMDWI